MVILEAILGEEKNSDAENHLDRIADTTELTEKRIYWSPNKTKYFRLRLYDEVRQESLRSPRHT